MLKTKKHLYIDNLKDYTVEELFKRIKCEVACMLESIGGPDSDCSFDALDKGELSNLLENDLAPYIKDLKKLTDKL